MTTHTGITSIRTSQCSIQSSNGPLNLAKTLQVQDQIIEQLRADQVALKQALEAERTALKECRITSDRELKAFQRENIQLGKINKQQEMKIEELEKEVSFLKESLTFEQKNLKSLEKEHVTVVKELKLKMSKDFEKISKQELLIDQLKSEVEDLKEALQSERNATNLLIREHAAEVKMLREEVKMKATEAYRELKDRATREREEYREMQEEAERTFKILEKDFRDALAAKDEELRRVKAEAKLIQRELEDQLRASLKEANPTSATSVVSSNDCVEMTKFRRLKTENSVLREQNRKLLNEIQALTEDNCKLNELSGTESCIIPYTPLSRNSERKTVLGEKNKKSLTVMTDKGPDYEITRMPSEYSLKKSTSKDGVSVTSPKPKPAVPKKPAVIPVPENDANRSTHVRDMVRRLQGKDPPKPVFMKLKKSLSMPEKTEMAAERTNQTLEDLKAIDEDIEKLRKQIEERDKIIGALREAAEAKDKKLEELMVEYSKLQSKENMNSDTSQEPNRATSSSPSSPPLCNGELCWTDNFVNKNYHEPVYAQLLNDHTALQNVYNDLRAKLESKGKELERLKAETEIRSNSEGTKVEAGENGINLIMAEQIRVLKEREAQLIWEAEELREQNDLMEFRILELEEARKEFLDKEMLNESKHRSDKIMWRERDLEEISDSGVMSLPTSEDLTSDSELGETVRNYSPLGGATTHGLSTPENSHFDSGITDLKLKKSLKSFECLQESGIFVDSEPSSDCAISPTQSKACQTETILHKALVDIIDSSCDLFLSKNSGYLEDHKSDDLTTEISKLSVIQKRIQQKTKSPTLKSSAFTCPHSNSVVFYEERLAQLEDKLKIYESSGDIKDTLLAKRLQKEVELAHRVKELTDKVASLEAARQKLEEEKCEFEEAENDTRFQCQRLEIRLQELIDKNTELEIELERQKVIMSEERKRVKKKGSLESLLSRYEQRNSLLEEKEEQARKRLSLMEAAMPAIVAYNMFKMVQNSDITTLMPKPVILDKSITEKNKQNLDPAMVQRLEEILNDQKKLRLEYEKVEETAADREKLLREKIEELEAKAAKDREMIEEMTNSLKDLKTEEKPDPKASKSNDLDLLDELKQMIANEIQLRAQIDVMEKKEQAYIQSLENADEIWAGMESDYKRRLREAEEANNELQKRISQLEAAQIEMEKSLSEQPDIESVKSNDELHRKMEELMFENEKLKMEITQSLEKKFDEHRKFLEMENASLREELKKRESDSKQEEQKHLLLRKELEMTKEELQKEKRLSEKLRRDLDEKTGGISKMEEKLQSQIMELTEELNLKSKELSNLEVTVAELREEVETLEAKVTELVDTIQSSISGQEVNPVKATPKEVSQWSLSAVEPRRHTVSINLETAVGDAGHDAGWISELPVYYNEISTKKEADLPVLQVLIPLKFRYIVFAANICSRQSATFVFPYSDNSRQYYVKKVQHFIRTVTPVTLWMNKQVQRDVDPREGEIFQLSLKNTELLQTLEKMEEESKLKDKELEQLQKIAFEIRKEQKNLEILYNTRFKRSLNSRGDGTENRRGKVTESTQTIDLEEVGVALPVEELRRTQSIGILQIINPTVVKTSEQIATSFSSLQIALDNLQNKCRCSNFNMTQLAYEPNQTGDNPSVNDVFKHLALEYSSEVELEKKNFEGHPEKTVEVNKTNSALKLWGKNNSASYPALLPSALIKYRGCRPVEVDPDFSFTAPITTIRKVGDDGIFLEWDVTNQPEKVTGFEIKVNGLLTHRVRSSTRNKALLRPLNLSDKISIQLFAMSENGRSMKSSQVTYPDEHFLLSKA